MDGRSRSRRFRRCKVAMESTEPRTLDASTTSANTGPTTSARAADAGGVSALLSAQMTVSALVGFVVTVIWAATGVGAFWPRWVWFALALALGLHWAIAYSLRAPTERQRRLTRKAAIFAVLAVAMPMIWALAGGGYFWPIWPILGLAVALAVNVLWHRIYPPARQRELAERVDVLTRTRRGAVDVQDAELRRIERDLHDGAQARLVALSMRLGRAEERFGDRPEVADVLREARGEASAAIGELRDLARGIAPPILADRGLEAAVEALRRRAAIPVTTEVRVEGRQAPVVETAAYFVVAETLTNVAKHADGAGAHVAIRLDHGRLDVTVADSGPGGADPDGAGLSGLRNRVEALDGTLRVTSPLSGGTTVHVELPCE